MAEAHADKVEMLRHALATLAYRSAKALRDAPPEFAGFHPNPDSRTPAEILAHMGDLLDWAVSMAKGEPSWHDSAPLEWDAECSRYFRVLGALDQRLEAGEVKRHPERIFQGPIADALTHTGQLTFLRGMAGCPVRPENYYAAPIHAGSVGPNQGPPAMEFDRK
ncbi:MAG: hypothetical protein R2729_17265 [Bryobacteraceae bacterium]